MAEGFAFTYVVILITEYARILIYNEPDRLECFTVEISKPYSRPFLVSMWYRPPNNSPPDVLIDFGVLHLVGDMNINQVTRSC